MKYVLPNTIQFAVIVGPGGYILSFMLAWMLAQLPKLPRTVLALILYSPSMTSGVAMSVVWLTFFSGDQNGYLNSLLLGYSIIQEPIQWLQSPQYLNDDHDRCHPLEQHGRWFPGDAGRHPGNQP